MPVAAFKASAVEPREVHLASKRAGCDARFTGKVVGRRRISNSEVWITCIRKNLAGDVCPTSWCAIISRVVGAVGGFVSQDMIDDADKFAGKG